MCHCDACVGFYQSLILSINVQSVELVFSVQLHLQLDHSPFTLVHLGPRLTWFEYSQERKLTELLGHLLAIF